MDIKSLTVKDVRSLITKKEISTVELHGQFLNLIKKEDKNLHAYLDLNAVEAKDFASTPNFSPSSVEGVKNSEHLKNLSAGELQGVPLAIKDNICVEGTMTTAGSKILKNHRAVYDATVIKKLKKAGAVFLGKTNLDEFAMGSSTENSAFGPTKNPHDHTRVPGGSSGGSAAAVAAGLAVAALGSDTGGSIRQPASFCGVVGLKPTYGRVSRYGLIALASSLDQIGPITKTVYDAALLLNILSGRDPMDSTTVHQTEHDFTAHLDKPIKGLKIAMPKEYFGEGLDSGVNNLIERAITKLESFGAHVDQVSLPHSQYALETYYLIMPSEASANLARFDGIRYGFSSTSRRTGENILDTYLKSRSEGFGDEVRRRIILGTYALSAGYYDAYYLRAQKARTLIRQDFEKVFEKFDVIIGPTTPTVAFKIGEKKDPVSMYLSDIYTVPVNLAGLPGISVPAGNIDGLPAGLQIIGPKFGEERILQVAYNFEQSQT